MPNTDLISIYRSVSGRSGLYTLRNDTTFGLIYLQTLSTTTDMYHGDDCNDCGVIGGFTFQEIYGALSNPIYKKESASLIKSVLSATSFGISGRVCKMT